MARTSPETQTAVETLYAEAVYGWLIELTKAETVEADFGQLREQLKKWTKERIRQVSDIAGPYLAQHCNPSPPPRERLSTLKKQAIDFARKKLGI